MRLPLVIGHRGAKSNAPENTLAGLRAAHDEGARWVEFDVKLSADDIPVLIHDETLERTTTGRGLVRELTFEAISAYDAGCPAQFGARFRGERVPTLAAALDLLLRLEMGFNLEIKPCPGRERATAEASIRVLRERWPANAPTPILSSFKIEALEAARDLAPELPRGLLAQRLGEGWQDLARRLDCATIHPNERPLTAARVAAIKQAGYPVLAWTVNSPARAVELRDWGVDSLITDVPAALGAALA
jgi:glycerophosphoryl diester phosphodiesterase